jgi:hypothetical protein
LLGRKVMMSGSLALLGLVTLLTEIGVREQMRLI